jgi:hypothetical protein
MGEVLEIRCMEQGELLRFANYQFGFQVGKAVIGLIADSQIKNDGVAGG